MAKGSVKRIAGQNAQTIKNLRIGMIVPTVLSLVLRFIFRRSSLPPSKGSLFIYVLTYLPALFLSRYLENIGTSRRDPTTGTILSSGEDLGQPGVTEWCFDIIYVTWACEVGSGTLGEWFWWFYLVIPFYAFFKIWVKFIYPMFFRKSSTPDQTAADSDKPLSKRQEKLQKRSERGDPRVQRGPRK
ncbi:DUF788-domain-containing protein [Coniophora puteana RWD-64-598 SS2]|uniref:DUF788-domain-containing protein n=1 Tax=Coniophora puteana (strain RWD-64-598) TaxID=741705 RepID=A0A5M3MUV5_CONPW|nr:DUF788-domain-containing protein [Coniophora puteana RWD-64-598 SS2]EIW82534.1 DUF788-domain-containing protein [Coniophora puteana RWD-64-598 SS2]